jgi:lipopolysaccharide transport system permease protein
MPASPVAAPAPIATNGTFQVTIEAGTRSRQYWSEIWRFRELLMFLAWRDVAVRYKQTLLGVLWALIRPIVNTLVLAFVFGRLAGMSRDEQMPYILFVLAGQLPWQMFTAGLTGATNSLTLNARLLTKIYFPRLLLPASTQAVAVVDFLVGGLCFAALMVYYGVPPSPRLFALVPLVGVTIVASFALGLWLCTLEVAYRDVKFILPLILQAGLFLSPVGYNSDRVPEGWVGMIYNLNPMVGVINGFRWAAFGGPYTVDWANFGVSMGVILVLLVGGLWVFRRQERTFADVI